MPTSSAAVGSCWAATIASPEGDRKNSANATDAAIRTPKVISCCTVTGASKGGTRKNESSIFGIVITSVSLNCQNCSPMAVSATPAVATRSVTRGALRSGWMTRRSVSRPMATAAAMPKANAEG